jgi:prevent-host-death family protein
MPQFDLAEAQARFSELLQKAMLGEEVIVANGNKPVVKIVPIKPWPPEVKGPPPGIRQSTANECRNRRARAPLDFARSGMRPAFHDQN